MIPVPNVQLVLIIPDKVEETFKLGDSDAKKSETQMMNERKAQSRGTIFAVGESVEFWQEDDWVSFNRMSATEIKEDGVVYFSVHPSQIHCKFTTHVEG